MAGIGRVARARIHEALPRAHQAGFTISNPTFSDGFSNAVASELNNVDAISPQSLIVCFGTSSCAENSTPTRSRLLLSSGTQSNTVRYTASFLNDTGANQTSFTAYIANYDPGTNSIQYLFSASVSGVTIPAGAEFGVTIDANFTMSQGSSSGWGTTLGFNSEGLLDAFADKLVGNVASTYDIYFTSWRILSAGTAVASGTVTRSRVGNQVDYSFSWTPASNTNYDAVELYHSTNTNVKHTITLSAAQTLYAGVTYNFTITFTA